MKGIRFYIDKGETKKGSQGLAVLSGAKSFRSDAVFVECIASVYDNDGDGPYCTTSAQDRYIASHCERITESKARELFPNLVKLVSSK